MAKSVRSRSKQRKDNPGSNQQVGEQQPSDEQPKQKEAPPESQDILLPDQGKEVEGGPVAQGQDLEADLQELPQAKAGGITKADPGIKGPSLPSLEPIKMPEAGEGLLQI